MWPLLDAYRLFCLAALRPVGAVQVFQVRGVSRVGRGMNGFFLLHRELFDKLWFRQLGPKGIAVVHILARAQWGEGTLKNGKTLARGQCVVGRKELAKATGLSEKQIRSVLGVIQVVGFAAIEGTSEGTLVTINNYEYYQDISNFLNIEGANKGPGEGPTKGQRRANGGPLIKEGKERKESIHGDFERLWAMYPRREGKKQALKHFQASVKTPDDLMAIEKAIKNYLAKLEADGTPLKYTKQGSTFFNNWRDYVPTEGQPTGSTAPAGRIVLTGRETAEQLREMRNANRQ